MLKNVVKIITPNDLSRYKQNLQGKKTVLVGGCFDLFHYGHYSFLQKAKEAGNYLIVAVESDDFIRRDKKRQPIHTQLQRAEILAGLNLVDLVIILPLFSSDNDYSSFVESIRPKIIAMTKGDPQAINKKRQARLVGGTVKIVTTLLTGFSTQKIIDSLT